MWLLCLFSAASFGMLDLKGSVWQWLLHVGLATAILWRIVAKLGLGIAM